MPWSVDRYTNGASPDRWRQETIEPGVASNPENQPLYILLVFPGISWANLKRDTKPNQIPRNSGWFPWTPA